MKSVHSLWRHLLCAGILLCSSSTFAQRLSSENKLELVLDNGMDIVLFKGADNDNYYYLPPAQSIRLSQKEDGVPEFLFVNFTTEKRVEQGGSQGALLHFLLEWGLTPEQMKELQLLLTRKAGRKAVLAGPVELNTPAGESFRIVSSVLSDKKLTSSMVTSGMAPPMPGNKAAVAAHVDAIGAQLLDATFKKSRSISDVSIVLDYEYVVMVNAARGRLTYNLDITHTQGDGIAYDMLKKELDQEPQLFQSAMDFYEKNKKKLRDECGVGDGLTNVLLGMQAIDFAAGNTSGAGDTGNPWEYGISEELMRKVYDEFSSREMIKLEWEENIADDERLKNIREAFFNFFLSAFAEPAYPEFAEVSKDDFAIKPADESIKNSAQGGYKFKSCTKLTSNRSLKKTMLLEKISLPIRRRYQMTTNLASTYDQVKDNPNCVLSINLNDPFFEHRDINFILDLEAMDIFKEEINYVTVNVRKKRSTGRNFEDHTTISPEILASKGRLATLTYSREGDKNADYYEYKAQWSLRGGVLYPVDPLWQKGDWQSVTLAPPIKPRTIEFEADIDELKSLNITRATLQLRYKKYGQEVETNIPLTISKNQPLVSKRIFTDRDQTGYAYRLVLNHKTKGKLALDWDARINDDYVFAILPDPLKNEDREFIEKLEKAAEIMIESGPNGEVRPQDRILDNFKETLKMFIDKQ
ncbi:MAG TPA: hypothetical protein PLO67_13015 [Saprospiraceae bacterium]|nr:hypothetical protein [Saprospiraceae bacterium]HPI06784.1 hypothetical protein [Saprospiraceae bacterium]